MKSFWFLYAVWLIVTFIAVTALAVADEPTAAGVMAVGCAVVSATLAAGYGCKETRR